MPRSALYTGRVVHERGREPKRTFSNRIMMPLLYLDEIEGLRLSPLLSSRWGSIIHFRRKDFVGDSSKSLDQTIRELVTSEIGFTPTGPIAQLGHIRTWGWLFNPIVLYYCFNLDETSVDCVVATVSNTPWGETHNYVIDTRGGLSGLGLQEKQMHVSPFLPMDFLYRFRLSTPVERITFSVSLLQGETQQFRAGLDLRRVDLNRLSLLRALVAYPFQTVRVSWSIYWQALLLTMRRATFYAHPRKNHE